jgi:endonuclease/exonuclease/phosphatase family metal-dependent hydrolase
VLKVLTLNVWNRDGDWPRRLPLIHAALDALDPDVVGFQEVLRSAAIDQLAELVGGRGYHVDYVEAQRFWKDPSFAFGNAVASRWPIVGRFTQSLPDRADGETRAALTVHVEAPFGALAFTSTHLNWKLHQSDTRQAQVRVLAEHVLAHRPHGGFPPILVGDFNAEPDSDEIRFLCGLHVIDGASVHFRDCWRVAREARPGREAGYTWSNDNPYTAGAFEPNRRLDYVFVGYPDERGRGFPLQCRVVCDEPRDGVWPSDHFGVYAELRTEPAPGPRGGGAG